MPWHRIASFAAGNVFLSVTAAAAIFAVAVFAACAVWLGAARAATKARHRIQQRRAAQKTTGTAVFPAEDAMTVLAACVATAVSMNGMWRFFGNVLHFSGPERVLLFSFMELCMVTCALRARRNVRQAIERGDPPSAGVDGGAVWVLAALSGFFSARDASSGVEAMFRLAPPMISAWMWERSLAVQRRAATGKRIHSRLTVERILVWARIAEPSGRTTTEVDTHRRIAAYARATSRHRDLVRAGTRGWRVSHTARRRRVLLAGVLEHTGLASDEAVQRMLSQHLGALYGADKLLAIEPAPPWGTHEECPAGSATLAPAAPPPEAAPVSGAPPPSAAAAKRHHSAKAAAAKRAPSAQELADLWEAGHGLVPTPSINQVLAFARERGTGVSRDKARVAHNILEEAARITAVR